MRRNNLHQAEGGTQSQSLKVDRNSIKPGLHRTKNSGIPEDLEIFHPEIDMIPPIRPLMSNSSMKPKKINNYSDPHRITEVTIEEPFHIQRTISYMDPSQIIKDSENIRIQNDSSDFFMRSKSVMMSSQNNGPISKKRVCRASSYCLNV